jgi:hypothetical protein
MLGTPEEYCSLFEAVTVEDRTLENVYLLGSYSESPVTVASQQSRAINLVHELLASRRLATRAHVAVLGGGAAGLTAAAYALSRGLRVTVFETRSPLWNLRGCRTRWLHPNLFRLWPTPGWDSPATDFPVMNWYAGYAADVGDLLWEKYRAYEKLGGTLLRCLTAFVEPAGDSGKPRARYQLSGVGERSAEFDAIIVAVGFGTETRVSNAAAAVYWLDDALEREDPERTSMRYLISGSGDGGLTDLLRIRFDNFRHHHLRRLLLDLAEPRLLDDVSNAESIVDASQRTERYLSIARNASVSLAHHLRSNTSVFITNRAPPVFSGQSWPVSRFLASQLLVNDTANTRYIELADPNAKRRSITRPPRPPRFRIHLKSGDYEYVDAIVYRHGPLNCIDTLLRKAGLNAATVTAIRSKWHGERSDAPRWTAGPNFDTGCRSRIGAIQGPFAGRTVIGMLSRLLGLVGPDSLALRERWCWQQTQSTATGLLVDDEIVERLATHGDRLVRARVDAWRLPCEVPDDDILTSVVAADARLSGLWAQADEQMEQLRHHWVLPRPEWLAPDGLLTNTRVARHWRSWELDYRRLECGEGELRARRSRGPAVVVYPERCTREDWEKLCRRSRTSILLGRVEDAVEVHMPGENRKTVLGEVNPRTQKLLAVAKPLLLVLDLCARQCRVAFAWATTGDAIRLATELGAGEFYSADEIEPTFLVQRKFSP